MYGPLQIYVLSDRTEIHVIQIQIILLEIPHMIGVIQVHTKYYTIFTIKSQYMISNTISLNIPKNRRHRFSQK